MKPKKLFFPDLEYIGYEVNCKFRFPKSYNEQNARSIQAYLSNIRPHEELFLELGGPYWGMIAIRKGIVKLEYLIISYLLCLLQYDARCKT